MIKCQSCGAVFDEREFECCPQCGENMTDDVVVLDLPAYREEVSPIIGTVDDDRKSFRENRAEIYRRNELMAQETFAVEREKENVRRETERMEVAARKKELDRAASWKKISTGFLVGGAAVLAVIAITVGAFLVARNSGNDISAPDSGRRVPAVADIPVTETAMTVNVKMTTAVSESPPAAKEETEVAAEAVTEAVTEEAVPETVPAFTKEGRTFETASTAMASYSYSVKPIENGDYVRVDLCFQALSEEVKYFYPRAFSLVAKIPHRSPAIHTLPEYYTKIEGVRKNMGMTFAFDGEYNFMEDGGSNNDRIELPEDGYLEISLIYPTSEDTLFSASDYRLYDGLDYSVQSSDRRYDYDEDFTAVIELK